MTGSPTEQSPSTLKAGNQALRSGQPVQAVALYVQGMLGQGRPFGVYELMAANLLTARRQWLRTQQGHPPQLAVLAPEHAAERSAQLAQAHSAHAQVSHLALPDTSSLWFAQLADHVRLHPLHALQLIDPDATGIAAALLYQTIWGTQVWVDLCHTSAQAEATDLLTHQLTDERTPRLLDAAHPAWPSLALIVAPAFDVLTVATPALQQRHGGTWLPPDQPANHTVQTLWHTPQRSALPLEAQRLANALWRQAAHGLLALRTEADQAHHTRHPMAAPAPAAPLVAVLVHAHYAHIWPEIAERLAHIRQPFDLLVTAPHDVCQHIGPGLQQQFAHAQLLPMDADSDLAAFVGALPHLLTKPYTAICKLHTKQGQGEQGALWRRAMLNALIGHPDTFAQVAQAFVDEPRLTIAGPAELYLSAQRLMLDNRTELEHLFQQHHQTGVPAHDWGFFAGSCLWLRPQAVAHLASALPSHAAGQRDGTWAHALERYLGHLPHQTTQGLVGLLHRPAQPGAYALQLAAPGAHISHSTSRAWMQAAAQLPEQLQQLERTAGFDAEHYLQQYPALAHTGACLPSHYLLVGHHWGLHPLRQHPAIQLAQPYRAMSAQIPWAELAKAPKVPGLTSIVIPALNHGPMTLQCLQSVVRHTEPGSYEIILVDNGSDTEHAALMADWVARHPQARLLRHSQNTHFAHGCNSGAALTQGEFIVLLNNDTQVTAGWLPPLVQALIHHPIAACQPLLTYPDGAVQNAGVLRDFINGTGQVHGQNRWPNHLVSHRGLIAVTGACTVTRAYQYLNVRGFDASFVNGQEDTDLCLRMTQNHRAGGVALIRSSRVTHAEARTPGRKAFTQRNRQIFRARWPQISANRAAN